MGRRLKHSQTTFDRIYASPAERAYKTAKLIAREIEYPEAKIVPEISLYGATLACLISYLRQLDDALDHVAIVAHNPGLTDFLNALTGEGIDNIPTSGIVTLKLKINQWPELGRNCESMTHFDYPKKGKD